MTAAIVPFAPPSTSLGTPTRAYRIEVGGVTCETLVYIADDEVTIPIAVRTPSGGRMRGMFVVDRPTFDRVERFAKANGIDRLRLEDLAQGIATHVFGHTPLVTIKPRRLLSRRK